MWPGCRTTRCASGSRSGSSSGGTRTMRARWSCRCSGLPRARPDMDFTPTEAQAGARELAARIFSDLAGHDRLAATGTAGDPELWKALCGAGLVGAVEELGLLGLVLLLEEQGRTTAQVPYAASCVYGLLAVAAHGTPEQR